MSPKVLHGVPCQLPCRVQPADIADSRAKPWGTPVRSYILDYYGDFGPAPEEMAKTFSGSPGAVREKIQAFGDVGVDELIFWPSVADLEQLERLADVVA